MFAKQLVWLLFFSFASLAPAQTEEEIDRWFDRGERLALRGSWRRAMPQFEKVVKAAPADEEAADYLLQCYRAAGRHDGRDKLTEAWLARQPRSEKWRGARVDLLIDTGRDDEVVAYLEPLVKAGGVGLALRSRLAAVHESRGRIKAAEVLNKAIVDFGRKHVIKDAADLVGLANAYLYYYRVKKNPDGVKRAEAALIDAQEADKNYLPAYAVLARAYLEMELPGDAAIEVRDGLRLRPHWPPLLLLRAEAAAKRLGVAEGDRRKALAAALKVNPSFPAALFMRGMDRLGDGNWSEARESFSKGLAANPRHLDCLAGLAALEHVTGQVEAFARQEKALLELRPGFGRLYHVTALALDSRRRWEESYEMMKRAVEVDDARPLMWDDLARFALYVGDEENGLFAIDKADALVKWGRVWRNNTRLVLSRLAEDYETIKTDHVIVKLHKDELAVLQHCVPSFVERSWAEFVERYGFEPKAPILWEVFKDHGSFSARTMGIPGLGALGVCFGQTVSMDSPRARPAGTYNWEATAHHELAHVFTLQLSRGRTPRWLTEGLSTLEEVRRDPSWGRNMELLLHDAVHNDKLFKVVDFDAGFRGPRIIFAYYQGGLVCDFIEKTWGFDKIIRMLKSYGEDKRTPAVLREALGLEPEAFDAQFRDWVVKKLEPLDRIPSWDSDAISRARKSIDEERDVVESRLRMAWGYFRAGKPYDSDAALEPLIGKSEDPRIDLLLAARAARDGRQEIAQAHWRKAYNAGSRDVDMLSAMAITAERDGRSEEAVEFWTLAEESNPWATSVRIPWPVPEGTQPALAAPSLILARLARGGGDHESWARWTEKFCALIDVAVDPRKEVVVYYEKIGNKERAAALCADILRVVPYDADTRWTHANLLRVLDDRAGAIVEFETLLELAPKQPREIEARLNLARLLLDDKRIDDAENQLDLVLELDSGNVEAKQLMQQVDRR